MNLMRELKQDIRRIPLLYLIPLAVIGALVIISLCGTLIATTAVTSDSAYGFGGFGNTTTLGNGSDPANTTIAPSGPATMADSFTFVTNSGSDVVSSVTVTVATGTYVGISKVEITNSAGTTVYGSVNNPAANSFTINLTTNTLTATTSTTTYKIRITPKTHAAMAAPPGASYAVTAYISNFNPSSNSSAGSDSAGTTVTIDNLSPGNITGATAAADSSRVNLSWTNPGDSDLSSIIVLRKTGGAVADTPTEGSSYSVGNTIGSSTVACVVSAPGSSCTDSGLSNGTAYYYKIFTVDSNGNYSATGVVPSGSPATPVLDVTAPAAVTLSIGTVTATSVQLNWTAPGDDNNTGTATTYDIRYSTSAITAANWASATQVSGEPSPQSAGNSESLTVTGLSPSTTYYFAIETADEVPNWSSLSNSPSATTPSADTTPPAAVIDLNVTAATTSSLTVAWTAPGDDGNTGTATTYDIRYSTSPITAGNWASATQASGEPSPAVAGSAESFTLTGLSTATTYYIAIKTSDEVPNTSGLSNVAVGTTSSSSTALALHPSGSATGDGASYTGGTAATAMDSNDADTSYGSSISSSNDFFVNLDDTAQTGTITSVQIGAVGSSGPGGWGSWGGTPSGFKLGVKTGGTNYYDGGHTSTSSYVTYTGTSYATNPNTGVAWTWTDINNLIATVDHSDANEFHVTELYATVNYVPGDTTPPAAVTLSTGALTDTSVVLNWTAPGDDGSTGTAQVYDIRYSTSAITSGNWASATQVSGEPTPSVAGTAEAYTVTGLSPNTTYYFAIKTADEVPNWSSVSNSPSATTLDRPVGGYSADNVIPAAQISQATNGSGLITITWKGRDNQTQNVTLKTFQYSTDGGATWTAPTNGDASGSLSTNWNNNGGGGWTTATTFAAATAHSFTFNTKHADAAGINGADSSTIRVRFTLNDGGIDSASPAISDNFRVDDLAPTATITSAIYDAANDRLTITGTNFTTIATAGTDIKSYVDWTKFVWDINGDNAVTPNISFTVSDVTSLTITNATTLTLQFTAAKGIAIESTTGYSTSGGADTLDVTAGFIKDSFGNAATTDGVSDGTLITTTVSGTVYYADENTPLDTGVTVRMLVNGVSVGTATTDASGNYTVWGNVATGDAVLLYIDNDVTYQGVTVTIAGSAALSGINIYDDHVNLRHDNGGSLTNANLSTAKGAYVDTDILYSVSGGALTVSGTITQLRVRAGNTFAPGGNVTTPAMSNHGTYTGGSANLTVNGDFLNDGTFTASSGTTTVAGNFANTGTFTASGGTVVLSGTAQLVSGNTTFNNFTKTVASADTLFFAAGSTTTINGTATINGASGQLLSLHSSSSPTKWNFVLGSGATKSISYVDVKDSDASGSAVSQKIINPSNSTNSGNNIAWFPITITGTVYTDQGVTNIGAGKTVRMIVNGSSVATATTAAGGTYSISGAALSGDAVLLYIDNDATYHGNTVTISNGGDLSGIDIYHAFLIARQDNGGTLSNANLATAVGAYSDASDILYAVASNNLTVSGSNWTLYVPSGQSYTPGGNITTPNMSSAGTFSGGSGTDTINGALTVSASAFTATSGTTTVQGNLTISGGTFTHNSGTFSLTGANARTLDTGSAALNNLTINTTTTAITVNSTVTVSGDLTLTAYYQINGGTIAVAGNITTTKAAPSHSSSATLMVNGTGAQILGASGGTGTIPGLTINKASGTLTLQDTILVQGSAGWTWSQGTVNAGTSTVDFYGISSQGAAMTVNTGGGMSFNNVAIDMNAWNLAITGTMTVSGNLTLNSVGTLGSGTIAVAGDVTTTATAGTSPHTATISLNGTGTQTLSAAGGTGTLPGISISKTSGTLNLQDTLKVYGVGWTWTQGTVNAGTSTVDFYASSNGASMTVNSGSMAFNSVIVDVGIWNLAVTGTMVVAGDLTLSSATNINTGTIAVAGNLTSTDTTIGGTGSITLNGSGAQSVTASGGADLPNGTLTIDKTSGTATLAAALAPSGGMNLTVNQGTLDLAGYSLTGITTLTANASGTLTLQGGEIVTATTKTFNSGSTVIYNGNGIYSALAAGNTYSNLTFNNASGSWTHTGTLTAKNLTITAGTLLSGGQNINVSGNWPNSGTYTSGANTVTFNGTGQSITGNTTFNNLTKSVASADTLTFAAGSTQTVTGTLTLNGASGQLLSLRSSSSPTRWNLNVAAGATKAVSYVDVMDGDASASDASQKPIIPSNAHDSGNNVEWFPYPIITVTKISAVISDPVNGSTNPKRIPGAVIEYTIAPANSGTASPDAGTVYVTDAIDNSKLSFDVSGGVSFTDGTTPSGLTLGTVSYSNTAAPGPYVYTYTPVPDGQGYDSNVTAIKVTTTGTFAYGGSPSASFNLKFRAKVK